MSQLEQIFFEAAGELRQVGSTLAEALHLRWSFQGDVIHVAAGPDSELRTTLTGSIGRNIFAETAPETISDVSIFDDMPWVFEFLVKKSDFYLQQETALTLFRRMASILGWRSALTSEYATLVATQDPVHGYREFPEDTLSDATHADRWG